VTEAFRRNLVARGIDAKKIDVVTNGANLDLYKAKEKDKTLLTSLGLEGKFIVGYIGTHGMAHSLDFIITSLAKIDDPDIHFLFVGGGAVKQKIVEMAEAEALQNITFLDPISKEEVPNYLSIVDVSLAPLKKSDTFKTVIPSKIFEASAMHKPTLLGVEGQAQEIIEKYGAGICFKPEDEKDFLEKVKVLKEDETLYRSCVEGCGKLAEDFDRKRLAEKMKNILMELGE